MHLADAVHAGDGLQLQGRVDEGLAEEDVVGVDEVEAARVGARVQKEDLDSWVRLEASRAAVGVDG
jgi:hypothetical protein